MRKKKSLPFRQGLPSCVENIKYNMNYHEYAIKINGHCMVFCVSFSYA